MQRYKVVSQRVLQQCFFRLQIIYSLVSCEINLVIIDQDCFLIDEKNEEEKTKYQKISHIEMVSIIVFYSTPISVM